MTIIRGDVTKRLEHEPAIGDLRVRNDEFGQTNDRIIKKENIYIDAPGAVFFQSFPAHPFFDMQ